MMVMVGTRSRAVLLLRMVRAVAGSIARAVTWTIVGLRTIIVAIWAIVVALIGALRVAGAWTIVVTITGAAVVVWTVASRRGGIALASTRGAGTI